MPSQVLELTVNPEPAIQGLNRMNGAIVGNEKTWFESHNKILDYQTRIALAIRTTTAHLQVQENMWKDLGKAVVAEARNIGNIAETTAKALVATGVAISAVVKGSYEAAQAANTLEKAWDGARVARIGYAAVQGGLTAALTVATEIAAVVAIERLSVSAYNRTKEIQNLALAANRTGATYENQSGAAFIAKRFGQSPDFFDSAIKTTGGVYQLGQELKRLSEIPDPVARVDAAFKTFGADTEKLLPIIGTRFAENAENVQKWGIALDDVSRTRIDSFTQDIKGLTGGFDSLGDSVATAKQQFLSLLQLDLASLYGVGKYLVTAEPVRAAAHEFFDDPNASLKDVTKDAQKSVQQRQSQDLLFQAQQEILRSLTPGGEKQFKKSQDDFDQEAGLRAEIADLQKKLFVQDKTSPDYGKLVHGTFFPGGYGAQAESLQKYSSDQSQLQRVLEAKQAKKDADEAAKRAAAELAAAEKSVASALQAAQISELTGADKLRAEREIAIQQYGKTKQLVSDINKEFDIKFYLEGKAIIAQSAVDVKKRADAEAAAQATLLTARTGYTTTGILNTVKLQNEGVGKQSELDTQTVTNQRDQELNALQSFGAKTLQQKVATEDAKYQIEVNYFERIRDLESATIDRGYQKQLADLKVLFDSKLISEKLYLAQKKALDDNEALDQKKLDDKTDDDRVKAASTAATAISSEYQREFDKVQAEIQKQHDQIATTASGLYHTLFTDASKFGPQLRDTVKEAALKPVTDKLGNATADALQGIGITELGRKHDPVKSQDNNTDALINLTNEIRALQVYGTSKGNGSGGSAGTQQDFRVGLSAGVLPLTTLVSGIPPGGGTNGPGDESLTHFFTSNGPVPVQNAFRRLLGYNPSDRSDIRNFKAPIPLPPDIGKYVGRSKLSGTPVNFLPGSDNGPLGDFDRDTGQINLYTNAHQDQYSAAEVPYGEARTLIHESAHAALATQDVGALNALLPPDFVKRSAAGLSKSGVYDAADASQEIIPRLASNESTGVAGFNNQKILGDFISKVRVRNPQLAGQLDTMGQDSGAIPRYLPDGSVDHSDLPSISDLLSPIPSQHPALKDFAIRPDAAAPASSAVYSGGAPGFIPLPTGGFIGAGSIDAANLDALTGISTGRTAGGEISSNNEATGEGDTVTAPISTGRGFINSLVASGQKSLGGILGGKGGGSQGGIGGLFGGLTKGSLGSFTRGGGLFRSDPGGTPGISGEGNVGDETDSGDTLADPGGSEGTDNGHITGVDGIGGAALVAGGTYFAEKGLLGADRGTGAGVLEGTLGGAAIGLKYGGPIGAAVGAAVGLGIGVGEVLAGVESPRNEVKRIAKQRYGITISSAVADNLAALAKSKFAGSIPAMMASPEVRQTLELYAAGTGQKIPQSASTPHAGSLIEQNGQLEQQATYQFGQAYTFQSSLPVAGGISTQQYASPGGGNQPLALSISVGGKGAGDFMAGSVVTPDFVQAQWSNAQQSSNGRVNNAALYSQPGLIVS